MIPIDFEYYRPAAADEAVRLFQQLSSQGKEPVYYSGGTEIITLARINLFQTRAVIDIKGIPECSALAFQDQKLVLGSALTLSRIYDSNVFPLLGEVAAGIADRTSRNKITLGGNLFSRLIYREAVLPLLLTDSVLLIAGRSGVKQIQIDRIFDRTMQVEKGDFVAAAMTDLNYLSMRYAAVKKRKIAEIDYPLVSLAAIRVDGMIRLAFSGVCAFPFRSRLMEEILNRGRQPLKSRIEEAVGQLPAPILSDIRGSAEYREYVLKNVLSESIRELGGA
ncbi:FAD binding domain-containing protein [Paenibacillus abyssi]|uniref:Xanthine dehydrogenase n=1 Tax=Paenibacillus abyssi TaxID=1340531 RepID=A0A917FS43_9BACL|nr:FAD binding domain-containing protein [Paenibacillus abyssi]GGG03269.1 xanthine dehydrogenase [Paenibacillus abyssi]